MVKLFGLEVLTAAGFCNLGQLVNAADRVILKLAYHTALPYERGYPNFAK